MSQLAQGIADVGRGLSFLHRHPRLWALVIAPGLVTLLVLVTTVVVAARQVARMIDGATSYLPGWLGGAASWLLILLAVLALGAVALRIFVVLAGILSGPFCELLSEAVEETLDGKAGEPFQLATFLRDATTGIGHSVRRLIAAIAGALLLLALALVPAAGSLAAVAVAAWSSGNAAAYDCYDAVLARRRMSYADKLAFLRAHRRRTFGLGVAVTGLLFIPGVNLVALGLGAVGATLAMRELTAAATPDRGSAALAPPRA
jgi:CysZ protein